MFAGSSEILRLYVSSRAAQSMRIVGKHAHSMRLFLVGPKLAYGTRERERLAEQPQQRFSPDF